MKYTNIFEKLICLFNIAKSNWISLVFLAFVAFFLIILKFKKITKKQCFTFVLISYLCFLVSIIITYNKQLGIIGDNLVNNLFKNIYFPSTYTYLFVLIVVDITTLVALLNKRCSTIYKWLHGIIFFLIQFILAFILELLSKNKIDIFSKTSLFSNKNLVMMLELSMNIFIIWLIAIIFIYLTNLITEKVTLLEQETPKEDSNLVNMNNFEVDITPTDLEEKTPSVPRTIPEIATYEEVVPQENTRIWMQNDTNNIIQQTNFNTKENIGITLNNQISESINNNIEIETPANINTIETNTTENITTVEPMTKEEVLNNLSEKIITPNTLIMNDQNNTSYNEELNAKNIFTLSDLIPKNQETIIPQPLSTNNIILDEITNDEIPQKEKEETNTYTLNDYRLFNKMLKEIKEHNENNTVTIDKDLEYRLITKYSTETYDMFKKMLKIYSN